MQKELEELQPKLVQASAENERMLVVIEKESTEVEATSKVVKQEEKGANEKAAEAQALKDEVCLSVCLSVCLFVWGACTYVQYICLSGVPVCPSVCLSGVSVHLQMLQLLHFAVFTYMWTPSVYCFLLVQCESDLAEAIPALEAAEAALNTLKVGTQ